MAWAASAVRVCSSKQAVFVCVKGKRAGQSLRRTGAGQQTLTHSTGSSVCPCEWISSLQTHFTCTETDRSAQRGRTFEDGICAKGVTLCTEQCQPCNMVAHQGQWNTIKSVCFMSRSQDQLLQELCSSNRCGDHKIRIRRSKQTMVVFRYTAVQTN